MHGSTSRAAPHIGVSGVLVIRGCSCLGVVESRARPARRPVAVAWGLEGGFGAAVVSPRVVVGLLGAVSGLLAVSALLGLLLALLAVGLGDGGGGAEQGRGDLVGLNVVAAALVAFAVLVLALGEAAHDDDAHAALDGLGDVFGLLAPYGYAEEQRVSVFPLVGLAVEGAGGGRDAEVGDGGAAGGEAEFGVVDDVPDHGDDRSEERRVG